MNHRNFQPRRGFGRLTLSLALALSFFLFGLRSQPARAQSPVKSLDVTYDGETYVLKAVMFAAVPLALAWEVLTDFQNFPKFVPNLRESSVIKPGDKQFTIEQKGVAKFGAFNFNWTSQREVVLTPQTSILSTQVKGSLKKQQSLMLLSSDGEGTRLNYRLELVPTFPASAASSEDLLKRETEEQFTAIVAEMLKRKK
jgi:ribosome-associated toxin RatA of RatAB toxin-antitoxin module